MSDTFTSTVDATVATFDVLWQQSGGRQIQGKAATSTRLLPYGPTPSVVVQSAGGMALVRTFVLRFASLAQMNNLYHCLGHHGTLATTEVGSLACTFDIGDDNAIDFDLAHNEMVGTFIADTVP